MRGPFSSAERKLREGEKEREVGGGKKVSALSTGRNSGQKGNSHLIELSSSSGRIVTSAELLESDSLRIRSSSLLAS